jgi:hypothetical protein
MADLAPLRREFFGVWPMFLEIIVGTAIFVRYAIIKRWLHR